MATIFNDRVISGTINGSSITYTHQLPHQVGYTVQVKYSGSTVSGSAKLQASINGTDFLDVEDSEQTFSAASSGGFMWDIRGCNYNYLKIVCTSSSGDVTFEAWLLVKRAKPTE